MAVKKIKRLETALDKDHFDNSELPSLPVKPIGPSPLETRLQAEIAELNRELSEKGGIRDAPIPCSNEECGRDTRYVNPAFTVPEKPKLVFCSRRCRCIFTGEPLPTPIAPKPATTADAPVKEPTKAKGKATGAQPAAGAPAGPKPTRPAPVPRAGGSSPWSNLAGKLFKTGKTPPNFQGNRKQVWEFIKDGMTVQALYDQCNVAGVDGKSNLAKIIGVYGCAEVR